MAPLNEYGQPVGRPLGKWRPPPLVPHTELAGRYVVLQPMAVGHAAGVYQSVAAAGDDLWTYMPFGPFRSVTELEDEFRSMIALPDWRPYVIEADQRLLGFASYLRIDPHGGVLEIGAIVLSPALQQTTAATEAIYLFIKHAFDSGYRRVEWKCDDLNAPSRSAAARFGFTYEGTFRNATHYKGRSRDTAWYAITVEEWGGISAAFESWLEQTNFDAAGRQIQALADLRTT